MARAPLLQLTDLSLTFGGEPVFADLSLVVQPGDRVALVGRNGSGKSTLMKVMAGLVEPDRGARVLGQGVSTGYMEQDPDLMGFATLGDYATAGLEAGTEWRVEAAAEGLKLTLDREPGRASGGERRRAALARLLAEAPELMLLDEPTNHLDIEAIQWLEAELKATRAAYVLISHDRAFLTALTRATLWIDRGAVRRQEKGFAHFEAWRDEVWAQEDLAAHKLDRKIKEEARWAVEGISARRTRNQGRLRELAKLRAERAAAIRRQGNAAMELEAAPGAGKRVIEARGLSKSYGDAAVVRDFDLRVMRGERIALVGPNGAGKTTLVNLLIGREAPDAGSVKLGTSLEVAVFDQTRAALEPEATLWDSLTLDPQLGVSGASDQVMVRGAPRHVAGYLKDFLFDERRLKAKVKSLSGGEKARLLLARIMALPSNLLVLDEPTNDLDVETLDLLQDVLGGFDGTVLLVSHDRDFVDRIADRTIAPLGRGRWGVFAGGWSDYLEQRPTPETAEERKAPQKPVRAPEAAPAPQRARLSFTESHRLDELPDVIARLEAEIGKLEGLLTEPDLYARDPVKFGKATEMLAERQAALSAAEEEWLTLAERAEAG
ncbi:ABC-F family ATP-binding cassette domain-containing protein [Jannaschia aquimarina]|uniref:Uup protein n=1 Tax=Jannaschia aquimarina TaxID=935700 RepID=A0A0D1DB85_9RHOB|nr:ATP-binding cassette domain-containing protein [Jannaschia aquimarina]KIT17213.1 ABC transporter ATP-binding protein uup [Jannaschia aquimarina]SNT18524.1 ATP-binding cassette, subfamily F, uup [Jannaschia aquimarina]